MRLEGIPAHDAASVARIWRKMYEYDLLRSILDPQPTPAFEEVE